MTEVMTWRDKSPDELADALQKLKKEQFNLRFQKANGQLQNTTRPREVRKDIARIMTIMSERARGVTVAPQAKPALKVAKAEAPRVEKATAAKPAKKPAKKLAAKKK